MLICHCSKSFANKGVIFSTVLNLRRRSSRQSSRQSSLLIYGKSNSKNYIESRRENYRRIFGDCRLLRRARTRDAIRTFHSRTFARKKLDSTWRTTCRSTSDCAIFRVVLLARFPVVLLMHFWRCGAYKFEKFLSFIVVHDILALFR